jgi:hypothetical protein
MKESAGESRQLIASS